MKALSWLVWDEWELEGPQAGVGLKLSEKYGSELELKRRPG